MAQCTTATWLETLALSSWWPQTWHLYTERLSSLGTRDMKWCVVVMSTGPATQSGSHILLSTVLMIADCGKAELSIQVKFLSAPVSFFLVSPRKFPLTLLGATGV